MSKKSSASRGKTEHLPARGGDNSVAENAVGNVQPTGSAIDFFNALRWDWCLPAGAAFRANLLDKVFPPLPKRRVDRIQFANLLAFSLSLSLDEKLRIVREWPRLSQFQVDALAETFFDERKEFARLFHEENHTIISLLFKTCVDWCELLFGPAAGEAMFLEIAQPELFDVASLPFSPEIVPRDHTFYTALAASLVQIGAPAAMWQACMQIAEQKEAKQSKSSAHDSPFWGRILYALPEAGNSIEQSRRILEARVHVRQKILDAPPGSAQWSKLISQGKDLLLLREEVRAIECFFSAYERADSDAALYRAASEILNVLSLGDNRKRFFSKELLSSFKPTLYTALTDRIAFFCFALRECNLALSLYKDGLCVSAQRPNEAETSEDAFDAYSIAVYVGEFGLMETYLQRHHEQMEGRLSQLAEIAHDEDYTDRLWESAFRFWMHFVCRQPSKEEKEKLNLIYGSTHYQSWYQRADVALTNKDDLAGVHLAALLQNLSNDKPLQTTRLLKAITTTYARFWILDNLYVASGVLAYRGEMSKARQLAHIAAEVYSINEEYLLGPRIPFTKSLADFAKHNVGRTFAGQAEEIEKFKGTITIEEFRAMLPQPDNE